MPEVLTFKIEDFEGPLDLLLYLVGKNKLNLYDVNIMELIEQYTAAIREMQQDRMEISSEFIYMAANLVQAGFQNAYAAEAKVVHAHKYT